MIHVFFFITLINHNHGGTLYVQNRLFDARNFLLAISPLLKYARKRASTGSVSKFGKQLCSQLIAGHWLFSENH